MKVQQKRICFEYIFLFASAVCGIFGIVFSASHIYAAVLPSTLPDALKKKIGIGNEISISGWAWNSAMGWVSQRGTITNTSGQIVGAYGIKKDDQEGVTGWSWSSNYGWMCWGKTCLDSSLDVTTYGNAKPIINNSEVNPDVAIYPVQTFPLHGDGNVEGTEQCDHGVLNGTTGDSCDGNGKGLPPTSPEIKVCGNGINEGDEVCDDGEIINDTNACKNNCSGSGSSADICGNGAKEGDEECDDGDRNNANACKNDCTKSGRTVQQDRYDFEVSGWVKIIGLKDDGWISLRGKVACTNCGTTNGEEYGVTYNPDHKEFRGWAWSPKLGWIVFSGRTLYDTPYRYAKVTPPGGSAGSEKYYDVTEYESGKFRITIVKEGGVEREYLLGNAYGIWGVSEFKRLADGTIDSSTVQTVANNLWDTLEVFDGQACQGGCDINFKGGKSTWKTQLSSPWIQTAGGNVFSRKGFGGSAVAFRPSSQYLLYSGGVTLEKDLHTGEQLELACCTDDKVIVTKIGAPETIVGTVYADLSSSGELEIIKKGRNVEKKAGGNTQADLNLAFSGLLEGEERRLKKNGGDVEVRIVRSLYASIEKNKTDMASKDNFVITRGSDGKLKKNIGGVLSDVVGDLQKALSSEERIIGAMTSWTSECDDPAKKCSPVGRKKTGSDDIVKADALNRELRPDIAFPQKQKNIRRNTLGSLDIDKLIANPATGRTKNIYGYKVKSITDERGFGNYRTNGMGNTILVVQGDLSIGQSSDMAEWVFENGTNGASGAGTIIVNGGNLYVNRPLRYRDGSVSDLKSLASVAWIVLEKDGRGGNIIFNNCIPPSSVTLKINDLSINQPVAVVAGIFFAEGTISTGKGDGGECQFSDGDLPLYVDGMMIARKFNFQRVYTGDPDLNLASESIQDTGRAIVNTPPGLQDILKSLPTW